MTGLVYLPPDSTQTFLATQELPRQPGVLIPLYVYPANVFTNADYNGIIDLARQYPRVPITVALNPSSGPGVLDGNYTVAIRRLQGAGIKILGYVHASYTARALDDVKADVTTWLAIYPAIDGLFVDEMTNDDSVAHRAYYTELSRYAHAGGLFPIVGNPGSIPGNAYWTEECADVIVVYENSGYPVEATIKGDFDGGLIDIPYERKVGLVYNATATSVNVRTLSKYVGQVYVTTDTGANPWDTVSTQLGALLSLLDVSVAEQAAIDVVSAVGRVVNIGNLGSTETITFPTTTTTIVRGTLDADCTISITTPPVSGASFSLELRQDGTGGRRAIFSGVTFLGGAGAVTPAANAVDLFTFYSPDGSTIYGLQVTSPVYAQSPPGSSPGALETMSRLVGSSARGLVSGGIMLTHFRPDADRSVGSIETAGMGTLSSGLTVAKMGIVRYNGGNSYTTIARTASDTTLWNALGYAARAIVDDGVSATSSVLLRAGVEYALAVLAAGTTMPQIAGASGAGQSFHYLPDSGSHLVRLGASITGQTDITSSIIASDGSGSIFWGAFW